MAAKEIEAREAEEPKPEARAPEQPKRRRGPGLLIVAIGVLAVLSILTASLWVDSQTRLMTTAHDAADFKMRLELLQEKMKKVEEERQRLSDENGTLSMQYEQRAAELAQLEEKLEALRSQKYNVKPKPRQPIAQAEVPPLKAPGVPNTVQGPASPAPRQERGNAQRLEKPEQRGVKVYMIN